MKVILTAFNGKLQSEPMDFPEGTRPEIYMMMDVDLPIVNMELVPSFTTTMKKAKFVATRKHVVLDGHKTAELYKLVDVS